MKYTLFANWKICKEKIQWNEHIHISKWHTDIHGTMYKELISFLQKL